MNIYQGVRNLENKRAVVHIECTMAASLKLLKLFGKTPEIAINTRVNPCMVTFKQVYRALHLVANIS